ncbi:glycosyltransferase [Chloroflexales bacterium ZM16-3]|nr:glycosyltransferase [Chloroflexales bacterium ZM16-3]
MIDEAIDIVISTIGQSAQIGATVASIRQSQHTNFTLWVLDQSVDDLTEGALREHVAADSRVQYRRVPLRGMTATRNSGAALGIAPSILFTNSDCTVDPGWAGAMATALREEGIWLAFGMVLPGPRLPGLEGNATVLAVKDWPHGGVYRGNRFELSFGHGHNMAVRRDAFTELGGFDELHGAGAPFRSWDDLDIGYRAIRRGGAIAYVPAGLAYHCHWVLWRDVWKQYEGYGIGVGAAVAKYVRCGDPAAWLILARWIAYHGLRQIPAGIWRRNMGRVRSGFSQLIYPWRGLALGFAKPVDRRRCLYQRPH